MGVKFNRDELFYNLDNGYHNFCYLFGFTYSYLAVVASQKKGNCIVPAFYHIAASFYNWICWIGAACCCAVCFIFYHGRLAISLSVPFCPFLRLYFKLSSPRGSISFACDSIDARCF